MTLSRHISWCHQGPPKDGGVLSSAAETLFRDHMQLPRICDTALGLQIITVSAPKASSRVSQLNFSLLCSSMIFPFPRQGYSFPQEKSIQCLLRSLWFTLFINPLYTIAETPLLYISCLFFSP